MKIALVAPSGVPFAVGGAEKLWWGLLEHVNRHTGHDLELIKLPSPERNFREVVASYKRFATLDLGHFDMVISTKYPAWMVAHDNHVVYLQHTLRGLYDTYPWHLRESLNKPPKGLEQLWLLLHAPQLGRGHLDEIFARLDDFLADSRISETAMEKLTAFPGPLIRAVVHALDRIALAPGAIRRYCAISRTVTERKGYFPPGVPITVVPHPSNLDGFRSEPGEFVFTASRLDGPKRLDLLVRAFRRCGADVPLVIAGEGPEEAHLRALAQGDARIRFAGRLTDDELVNHYARALLVPFIPFQEDMGLITLEAMKAGKPVLSVEDAGGVTEFVQDGGNGRIVPANETALAMALETMLADRARLSRMGEAALSTGQSVTWERTVEALLASDDDVGIVTQQTQVSEPRSPHPAPPNEEGASSAETTTRASTRLLVLNTFGVYPPDSGGKKRIFHLYQALSAHYDVTLLNLGTPGCEAEMFEFSASYREIRIPPDDPFIAANNALTLRLRCSVTDIAALLYGAKNSAFRLTFLERLAVADVVVASHVYLYPLIAEHWQGPVWYDAHNVEADMKADILGVERVADADAAAHIETKPINALSAVAQVVRWEASLVRMAERVLAVSEENAQRFAELYGRPLHRIEIAPNGTVVPIDSWIEAERRAGLKARLGFDGRPVALFVGSYHGPNLEATKIVAATARACPNWSFWVAGSVCQHPALGAAPANVYALGVLKEAELVVLLRAADAGLNPMRRGSGTNLKMLDYAANGVLVLSTTEGARGLGFEAGRHFLAFEPDGLSALLTSLGADPALRWEAMRRAAREQVAQQYSWETIAGRIAGAGT